MAIIVTLIVLLILAGVSLSGLFSEKGIFSRAENAGNRYNEAKARETLETVLLTDGQMEKQTNPLYNQDDFLDALIKKEIEGSDVKGDVAIIGEYAYELDRSVPKIGRYLGNPKDLIFPKVEASPAVLADDYRTASFEVTAIEETNGINKIEIWLNGERIENLTKPYSNVKTQIKETFTVNKNGTYIVKVYGDLMASTTVEVTGIVPAVEFSPNGSTEWKKEHTTKITVKETGERVTSLKYKWTTSGANEPKPEEFTETCPVDNIVTGKDFTGTYYLWVLLTTENNKTNICGSEGFNFDNTLPTANLKIEWIEEETRNRLKISVCSIKDEHSGVNIQSIKAYVTTEDGLKSENNIIINNDEGSIFIDGLDIETITNIELRMSDLADNTLILTKKAGRLYIVKNGKLVRGTIYGDMTEELKSGEPENTLKIRVYVNTNGQYSCGIQLTPEEGDWGVMIEKCSDLDGGLGLATYITKSPGNISNYYDDLLETYESRRISNM